MYRQTIAGIRRGSRFSPNHTGNDAAIFSLTAEALRKSGFKVNEYPESILEESLLEEPAIFGMARAAASVSVLRKYEDEGRPVINSAYGIGNCTRVNMTRLLLSNLVPHPASLIVGTDTYLPPLLDEASIHECWIKRGDAHAIHREDVSYARNHEEAQGILREFALRGIGDAVVNEHLTGDLVKFYGVRDTDFFYRFYPTAAGHSKFGLERINGAARGIPYDPSALQSMCNRAASILNISIYGGDCIVSDDGEIRLIDFNDWPSFAPCREEAAINIAGHIRSQVNSNTRCRDIKSVAI
ncbi:MAG: hypothetical protein LBJ58_00985 [Tannerellaceae bacterium]|jgi:hypothetical protein|nr:hypothetical protein [Tannerellaceae bacterium]